MSLDVHCVWILQVLVGLRLRLDWLRARFLRLTGVEVVVLLLETTSLAVLLLQWSESLRADVQASLMRLDS